MRQSECLSRECFVINNPSYVRYFILKKFFFNCVKYFFIFVNSNKQGILL